MRQIEHTAPASRQTLSTPYSIVELSRLYDPTRPLSTCPRRLVGRLNPGRNSG